MNYSSILKFVFLFFILLQPGVWGQESRINIDILQSSHVEIIKKSEKYLATVIRDTVANENELLVYNFNGDLLLREKYFSKLMQVEIIDSSDFCLVIIQGEEKTINSQEIPDEIIKYDIKTHEINWKQNAVSSSYSVSPDKRLLLTRSHPRDERKSTPKIINLIDGSLTDIPLSQNNYYAEWLGNKVVLLALQLQLNKNDHENTEKENEHKRINEIKMRLYNQYKNGEISESEYKEKRDRLTDQYFNVNLSNRRRGLKNKFITKAKLYTYDPYNNQSGLLLDYSSKNLDISFPIQSNKPVLTIDELNNIFIYGISLEMENTGYLMKILSDGNVVWIKKIDNTNFTTITKIDLTGNIFFRIKSPQKNVQIINKSNGSSDLLDIVIDEKARRYFLENWNSTECTIDTNLIVNKRINSIDVELKARGIK